AEAGTASTTPLHRGLLCATLGKPGRLTSQAVTGKPGRGLAVVSRSFTRVTALAHERPGRLVIGHVLLRRHASNGAASHVESQVFEFDKAAILFLEPSNPKIVPVQCRSADAFFWVFKSLSQVVFDRDVHLVRHLLANRNVLDTLQINRYVVVVFFSVAFPDDAVFLFTTIWPALYERHLRYGYLPSL